jgi:hypothetical protein
VRDHDMLGAPIELARLLRNEDRLNVIRHNFLPPARRATGRPGQRRE